MKRVMRLWASLAAITCAIATGALTACQGPAPRPADVIVVAIANSPTNFDPAVGLDEASQKLHQLLFSSLVRIDASLRVVPDLAVRLDWPDPFTYVAELPTGVRFHDGSALTAADVAFTFRRFLDPAFSSGRKGAYRSLKSVDVIELRKRVGMVFQKPNPFPMSIFENVVYSLRIDGERDRTLLEEVCERSLKSAGLWNEAKDRLKESALSLSGGQQQRLCIARAIAGDPEVLLLDEPCSALDPIATGRIEDLIHELKGAYTILIVTHNMQQAARTSDATAFMYLGRLIEYGPTEDIFLHPHLKETEDYVTGRFG